MYKSVEQILGAMRNGSPTIQSVTKTINRYYKQRDFEKMVMFFEAKVKYRAEIEDEQKW